MIGEGKVVCVTGASGFIASWLVKLLLQRGYTVHATVRSLDDPKKTKHLLDFDGAMERLSLFEASLLEEGSFESAVNGCQCVFHTASPIMFPVSGQQAQLLEPAVKGTLNVLKSSAKVPSLKRVVLTSSIAAVLFGAKPPEFGALWYPLSKTLAENAAVEFAKNKGLELVVINPGFVIGPILQPTLNISSEGFIGLIETDVANAHILAFENPQANGRYIMAADVYHSSDIMKIINQNYPAFDYSERYKDSKYVGTPNYFVSRTKAESLGVKFTTVEESIKDTAQLLDPAVKGTLNVLKSAAKVPSLKRVVLTSSIAAVLYGVKPPDFGAVVDETWFSDPETCEQKELWYPLAKTLAENAAVEFSKKNGLELVVINPGFVIGPILQPTLNITSEGFIRLIETGKEIFPDGIYRLVDVRDVANAHILAFENPQANGRYLLVANIYHSSDIMKIINQNYPSLDYSERYKDSKYVGTPPFFVSRTKAESLGVKFTTAEESIKDTVESLKEKKFLSF
uniref:Dihydroflavonol 4-reductase n=1 Tax=Lactuca sativa TaxID=4236 RepID=A0A9R1XD57_LACSA|nr:hypothetical protein LSAT_V11C400169050 [Lactuca sativa]